MAKLYFRYGTMGSAKTLNLLAVAHSYRSQGKRVLIVKPELDSRFGAQTVRSRSGLEKDADVLVHADSHLSVEHLKGLHCILVDESQFLSARFVDHLRAVSIDYDTPVICYGLRTDFRAQLFEGSKRLVELADCIEEIKSTCARCNRKAIFNMRLIDGRPTVDGPTVQLGAEESYQPMCSKCYYDAFDSQSDSDLLSNTPSTTV
jgi:thymidine kinase